MIFNDILLIVGAVAGLSVGGFIIWNSSKKITNLENQIAQQKEKFEAELEEQEDKLGGEIADLKEKRHALVVEYNDKLTSSIRDLESKVNTARIERREEITKSAMDQKEDIVTIQRQIDNLKSDIKDVAARVIIVDTKITHHDGDIIDLKKCDDEIKKFFADWNQRVEDRVEHVREELTKFRSEFVHMFSAFHAPNKNNGHEIE